MKIYFNPDKQVVEKIREGLRRKEGFCPCKLPRTEENVCMCEEFRAQIADEDFEGFCHCRLYYKEK
ncbi:MAG: ferredoxin thioredoxin reductase catalytic beta chain [Clostridia bacterium]|nr:ferredoxin thioredoxin reductase catalytic beta chain [Clostridia bacterium]